MSSMKDSENTLWLIRINNGLNVMGFKTHADVAFAALMNLHDAPDFEQRIVHFARRLDLFLADYRAHARATVILADMQNLKREDRLECTNCEGFEFEPHAVEGLAAALCKDCRTTVMIESRPDQKALKTM